MIGCLPSCTGFLGCVLDTFSVLEVGVTGLLEVGRAGKLGLVLLELTCCLLGCCGIGGRHDEDMCCLRGRCDGWDDDRIVSGSRSVCIYDSSPTLLAGYSWLSRLAHMIASQATSELAIGRILTLGNNERRWLENNATMHDCVRGKLERRRLTLASLAHIWTLSTSSKKYGVK